MAKHKHNRDRRVQFSSATADFADIVDFAGFLGSLFGNRQRGLASFVRLTDEYRQWRRRVEWCAHCRQYVAITELGEHNAAQLLEHGVRRVYGQPLAVCPGSATQLRWIGDQTEDRQAISRKAIQQHITAASPTAIDGIL